VAQQARWRVSLTPSGGVLSTADLVFGSDSSGRLIAFEAATGKILWEQRLQAGGVATPITYELDGRQYLSVLAGTSRGRVFTFALDAAAPMPTR
jgi:quinohemoprotein ethanol dehydrogenase